MILLNFLELTAMNIALINNHMFVCVCFKRGGFKEIAHMYAKIYIYRSIFGAALFRIVKN